MNNPAHSSALAPTPSPDLPLAFGLDIGGTKIECVGLHARNGKELYRQRVPTAQKSYDSLVADIGNLIEQAESTLGARGTLGIGMPGAEDPASGIMLHAGNVEQLVGKPFVHDVGQRLSRPVRLANDANCFALSEAVDGAGKGSTVVFGVIIGTGVGGGLALQGKVWPGINLIAGEWGHNALPWMEDEDRHDHLCPACGFACIETYLAGPSLKRDHNERAGQNISTHDLIAAAEAGDALALASIARYERRLAKSLAWVINLLDPEVFVLGGGMSNVARLYEQVPKLWGEWVYSKSTIKTRLSPPRHGDSSGVRGAAWLWRDSLDQV
jgi:fructokinase